jgi:hypothetical protein
MQIPSELSSLRLKNDRPFWQELEDMLQSEVFIAEEEGFMKGSMSGESWKSFLRDVRDEILQKLDDYRMESNDHAFCASILGPYREEKMKIERAYLRSLAALYRNAEKAYRSLSG